jgi:hypothetical protein
MAVPGIPVSVRRLFHFPELLCFYLGIVAHKEHHSPLPLLGGLLCNLALRGVPIAGVRPWAWLPWILDPGCVFLVGLFIYTAPRLSPGVSNARSRSSALRGYAFHHAFRPLRTLPLSFLSLMPIPFERIRNSLIPNILFFP